MTVLECIGCRSPLVAVVVGLRRKPAVQPVVARKDCLLVGHMDCLHFDHIGRLVARKDWFGHIHHLHRRCSRIAVLRIAVSSAC